MNHDEAAAVAPELRSTVEMVEAAFPNGVTENEYHALLTVLGAEMSQRQLAALLAHVMGRSWAVVMNDVYASQSEMAATVGTSPEIVASVKLRLRESGFDEWLRANGATR